jgi:hypothetical protein
LAATTGISPSRSFSRAAQPQIKLSRLALRVRSADLGNSIKANRLSGLLRMNSLASRWAAIIRAVFIKIFEEDPMSAKKVIIILIHAFIGWALCAATMGIGMATMTIESALFVHAIGAPIFFTIISLIYFNKFNYTRPLETALIFVSFVIVVDFFVVALMINRSLEMFASLLGTWIPFGLIFTSTYITGLMTARKSIPQTVP